MTSEFLKKFSRLGLSFSLVAAAGFLTTGLWKWALGVLVGAAWLYLNLYFLFRLIEIGMRLKMPKKEQILILSILKFPVLYAAGFFILRTRFFPVYSVLIGLTVIFASFTLYWMRLNAGQKWVGKAL